MQPQIVQLWKQTRTFPEEQQPLINQLFAVIEHVNEKLGFDDPRPSESYYQPNWFNDARTQ
jgi:hypothetical protein